MEKIQVVLASPSDLADERQMIKDLVNSLNPLYMKNGICIDLRMWENSTPGMNADGPQGLIDMDLEITNADLFICMYWKKIGTKLANEDVAGTEHELNLALDSYHKRRKPDIKAFFKVIDESEKNDDTRKISAISKKLQPLGLYTPFKDISELKDNVSKILQAEVMNLIRKQGQVMPEIHKYIEISDTNEFISNFSSNNKLVLNKGYYDMLDFERENTDNIFKEEVFDGNQLVVSNISNVTVVGDNSTLLVNPRYANVICFRECSNIKLIGLTLGHTPRKGSCMGSVLRFENCNNIQLDSLELFGCGTYGIEGNTATRSSLSEGLTPIYRFADVLLIYAEASNKAEGSPNTLAYKCLNRVRDRAFGDQSHQYAGLTPEKFADAVFDEFGWENVFEFKRWFQLVRTEKVDEAVGKNTAIGARLNANKENYLFPIPVRQCELRGWKNNPGY